MGYAGVRSPLYDLRQVAEHVVSARIDLNEALKDVKAEQLPEKLRESFWNAKIKELRYSEKAGDLWDTTKVHETIAQLLQEVRARLQLIPDQVDRTLGLDNEKLLAVSEIVTSIQSEIFEYVVNELGNDSHPNRLGEDEPDEGEGGPSITSSRPRGRPKGSGRKEREDGDIL